MQLQTSRETSKPSRSPARAPRAPRQNAADIEDDLVDPLEAALTEGPPLKSFRHVRNPKVRRAKEYEQRLLILRDLFPEFEAELDGQIAFARSQQERAIVSDRDRVLAVLEQWPGGLTCSEMAEDLEIPYPTAYKILREFLDAGIVAATERKGIAGNKPYLIFALAHASITLS